MASIRLRKKSNGCIIKSLRNQLSIKRFLGDLVHTICTKKLVFMRVDGVLQGRLFNMTYNGRRNTRECSYFFKKLNHELIMKKIVKILLFCFVFLAARAFAQGTTLTIPLTSSLFFHTGAGQPMSPIAGPATSNNSWILYQWNTSANLSPVASNSSSWTIANGAAAVTSQTYSGYQSYQLAQNGAGVTCPNEFDLFLQNDTSNGFTTSGTLSGLGQVFVTAGLDIAYSASNAGCSTTQNGYLYSFLLTSTTGQMLFYQIDLGGSAPGANMAWCPYGYEDTNNSQFCVDDDVRVVGGTFATVGANVLNELDVLPRLLQILGSKHMKASYPNQQIDSNPANWIITGVYAGSHVWGNTQVTANWYDLTVNTMPGGAFCSGGNVIQFSCNSGAPNGSGWVNVGSGCYQRNSGVSCASASLP